MSKNNSKEQLRERRHGSTIPAKKLEAAQGSARQENLLRAQQLQDYEAKQKRS